MLRALPAMVRTAASRLPAVRSGIFSLAISSSCLRETLPTLEVFGVALPFAMPIALAMSTEAGGVFMMKVKLRSLYTVITTGVGNPFSNDWVCALNALQNSMMFTPCWPRAGPTGGLGFAWPAGICSLIYPVTFFAIYPLLWVQALPSRTAPLVRRLRAGIYGADAAPTDKSTLFDLREIQLHGRRTPQDLHRHLQAVLLVIHRLHHTVEVVERAVGHAHHLTGLEQHLGLRLVDALFHAAQDRHGLLVGDRSRLVAGAPDEPQDLGHLFDQVPGVFVHLHLHEHIAREKFAVRLALLAVAHFHDFLRGHQNFAEFAFQSRSLYPILERLGDFVLEIRIGMNHVPSQRHRVLRIRQAD